MVVVVLVVTVLVVDDSSCGVGVNDRSSGGSSNGVDG